MNKKNLLEVIDISKSFEGVQALSKVSFGIKKGEVLGICGENGAGKSTLIKCLSGVYKPDSGTIRFNGEEITIPDENAALRLGISVIYQELSVVNELDIAQNIYIGRLPTNRNGFINFKKLHNDALNITKRLGLQYCTKTLVGSLNVSAKQMVEIGKAISRNCKVLIMDEPTSSLGTTETKKLFDIIKKLKEQNYAIIYISHHMEEIFEITDRVLVLRDGRVIDDKSIDKWDTDSLVLSMVNRSISNQFPSKSYNSIDKGEPILKVEGITNKYIHDVTFSIQKGEIVGLAGIVGAGRSEVLKSIYGAYRIDYGKIKINGREVKINHPKDALAAGLTFLPEDRKNDALCLLASVRQNMLLPYHKKVSKLFFVDIKKMKQIAKDGVNKFRIKTPSIEQPVIKLSGGNQQKVILARITYVKPYVYMLDEPTRGIDVNVKQEIYKEIIKMAESGSAVLLVTSELPELIGLADRILVMRNRTIVAELKKNEISKERIMYYATGGGSLA